jgi:hypothetical protein
MEEYPPILSRTYVSVMETFYEMERVITTTAAH